MMILLGTSIIQAKGRKPDKSAGRCGRNRQHTSS
jgi:hypothetical protein